MFFIHRNLSCLKYHKNDKNVHKSDLIIWYLVILIKDQFNISNIRFGLGFSILISINGWFYKQVITSELLLIFESDPGVQKGCRPRVVAIVEIIRLMVNLKQIIIIWKLIIFLRLSYQAYIYWYYLYNPNHILKIYKLHSEFKI